MKIYKYLIMLFTAFVVISSLSILFEKESLANEGDQSKLKFEKNSALALNYHRVRNNNPLNEIISIFSSSKEIKNYSVTTDQFESHIKWLKQHDAKFLTLKEFLKYKEKGKFPKRSVWINFDDMDNTVYDNAYPIIKKYKIPVTGYVITGHVGEQNFHNLDLISKSKLKEMYNSGLWEFETHTHDLHALGKNNKSKLLKVSDARATKDIKRSQRYLKENFEPSQRTIAYPYGLINESKKDAIKKAGIKYGFTLEEKAVTPKTNNYTIPRIYNTPYFSK